MGLFDFFNKNIDNKTFNDLMEYSNDFDNLLSLNKYISKKEYIKIVNKALESYNNLKEINKNGLLKEWCKKNKINYKTLNEYFKKYEDHEKLIEKHNQDYIKNELIVNNDYFDNILKDDDPNIKLDNEQREVVVCDEDYTLVVAGAGTGKTTTIEAKAKYLIEKKNIDPSKILIVSFTRKATGELKERFKRLNINVNISTFHQVGNSLIKENNNNNKHNIVIGSFMYDVIKDYLSNKLEDEKLLNKLLLFFASYLYTPLNTDDINLLYKSLSKDDYVTLKSDLVDLVNKYQKDLISQKRTINNEKVRSIDECRIANFLYINGIDYTYEPIYKYCFSNSDKLYTPDFLLKQGNKEIYLEHFGISQDGKSSRYSKDELETYKKHVNDKIKLHREHNTNLIYTFSKYNDGKDLIVHLEEELLKVGFVFQTKDKLEIYKKIVTIAQDKYLNKLIILICNFISLMKTNNYTINKFSEWKTIITDERTKIFLDICYQCYLVYSNSLKETNSIDFDDMINNAIIILDNKIKNQEKLDYEYIFVDEYQDISKQRFDLCERISKVSDAKIIAVGDDWQSIYKFNGSKIELFTNFEKMMGYAKIQKITKTYRNSQELIDIAGKFIMENDFQITKRLKSDKTIENPVVIMSYNDIVMNNKEFNKEKYMENIAISIDKALSHICNGNKDCDSKVLLIGRYGFDAYKISNCEEYFKIEKRKIIAVNYPNLKIDFMTAHSSKGLGYDNVIILNAKDDILGFPSKIEDDPLFRLIIKNDEKIDYAEERRLFYVALTRTKNRVYIITPKYHPSNFVLSLKETNKNINVEGEELTPITTNNLKFKCPICGYPLQKRVSKIKTLQDKPLWICSNDPEICGFVTNDISGGKRCISKCPECEDGYLIVKTIKNSDKKMLGCTNYKHDNTGCNHCEAINDSNIEFFDDRIALEELKYASIPIKDLINYVFNALFYLNKRNIRLNKNQLVNYFTGKIDKTIQTFELDKTKSFGIINEQYKKDLLKLLDYLVKKEVLLNDENNYNSLSINKEKKVDDNFIKMLYQQLCSK